jgi:competence protein ComEA
MMDWLYPAGAALLAATLFCATWSVAGSQTEQAPDPAAAGAPAPAAAQASDLAREAESLKAVCGRCHTLQMVTSTPRSYDAWHDTVQKMVDRGAKGTDDQYDDLMDYLHRTVSTIDVNTADADELEIVLNVSEATAQAIMTRRNVKRFSGLADLKSVPSVDAATLDAKARMIFFH